MIKSAAYWAILGILLTAATLLHRRGDVDNVPPSTPMAQFPQVLSSWKSVDIPISSETLNLLGKGDFLNRLYRTNSAEPGPNKPAGDGQIGLFIGYFPTQRSGQSIHSPQNCLPGSGWTFLSSAPATIHAADGREVQVNDYLISDGEHTSEVLYWYQSHGRFIANDYKAKLLMLTDAIRLNRTDAALVRIVVPIDPHEPEGTARARAVRFAEQVTPLLPRFVPN